jgi:hypothetical protein
MLGHGLAWTLSIAILMVPHASAVQGSGGGRVRVLCLGDIVDQYGDRNTFAIVQIDPAISVTLVPTRSDYAVGGIAEVWRLMRLYLPRTYEGLIQGYDVVMTSDTDRTIFRPEWIVWMSDSVREGGLGLLWLGFISSPNFPSWADTTIGEVLPAAPGSRMSIHGTFHLVATDREEPLVNSLDWEASPPLKIINTQAAKDGARTWFRLDTPEAYPLMTYWDFGSGAALNFAGHFPDGARPWSEAWRYFPQAMMFLVYRVDGRELPEDASLFEVLMGVYARTGVTDSFIESMLSWVETFGGNTRPLYGKLGKIQETEHLSEVAYMEGSWDLALDILGDVEIAQSSLRAEVVRAKDRALVWIYAIEWCTLLATFMVSTFAIWNLMVRRKLYREAGLSRLSTRTR